MWYSIINLSTEFFPISQNFMLGCPLFAFIPYSRFHNVFNCSFSCMQQILVNYLFIFILLQIFSNFTRYGFLDTQHLKVDI